jgi:hypothetical protein
MRLLPQPSAISTNMRKIAFLSSLLIVSNVVAGDGYETYTNERYGYSIVYPADFRPQGVPDAGDGQAFLSPNGDAELRVFASACLEGLNSTPQQYVAGYKKEQNAKQLTLSYQRASKNFAVVSGHKKDRIFYDKIIIHDDWCTQFTFEYSEDQAAQYNAVTDRISSSLKR